MTVSPPASLLGEFLARWPTAPITAVGESGRWLICEQRAGGTVQLTCETADNGIARYHVVRPDDSGRVERHQCASLDDAITTIRRLLVVRPATRRPNLLDSIEWLLSSPGDSHSATQPA